MSCLWWQTRTKKRVYHCDVRTVSQDLVYIILHHKGKCHPSWKAISVRWPNKLFAESLLFSPFILFSFLSHLLPSKCQRHCVTGAVLTHDVMYTGFYFWKPPVYSLSRSSDGPKRPDLVPNVRWCSTGWSQKVERILDALYGILAICRVPNGLNLLTKWPFEVT